ncbi:MAG: DUF177 domain-containing protein [Proteobacteria bacterium]|nr:DUF177 domain-containing protein [Pseudomonadota bacterium]TDJ36283.1 MAG: hypothetical protein E2O53_03995 [Gammaproteobacteria bacterium]
MANPLLDRALPEELAECGQAFELQGKIEDFRRLIEITEADLKSVAEHRRPREWRAAAVNIRLGFTWADARREIPALEGEISTTIVAVCQRCLEPFDLPLEMTLKMLLLKSADATTVQAGFEIWEVKGETVRPLDIVEDALIMALPLSAVHESRDLCGPLAEKVADDNKETVRPFAELRSQMNKLNG